MNRLSSILPLVRGFSVIRRHARAGDDQYVIGNGATRHGQAERLLTVVLVIDGADFSSSVWGPPCSPCPVGGGVRPGRDRERPVRAARSVVVPAGPHDQLRRESGVPPQAALIPHRGRFGSNSRRQLCGVLPDA